MGCKAQWGRGARTLGSLSVLGCIPPSLSDKQDGELSFHCNQQGWHHLAAQGGSQLNKYHVHQPAHSRKLGSFQHCRRPHWWWQHSAMQSVLPGHWLQDWPACSKHAISWSKHSFARARELTFALSNVPTLDGWLARTAICKGDRNLSFLSLTGPKLFEYFRRTSRHLPKNKIK